MSLLLFVASLVLAVLSLRDIRWAFVARLGVFAVLVGTMACTAGEGSAHDSVRGTESSVPRDTMPADIPAYGQANLDSLRRAIDSVEGALSKASDAERPRLLFELGRAKRQFIPERGTAHGNYAAAREDEFFYNEIGGNYVYTGKHLQELIERYPQHDLADDAGYELTLLPGSGECEGFVTCYIAMEWHDVQPFLKRFPTSAYARRAVDRAVRAYTEALKDVSDLTVKTDMYDPNELRPILTSFDSMRVVMPAPMKTRMDSLSQSIWARLGGNP